MVLALLLALLQGCSSIKLGYTGATTFSYWWLDRYLDFDRDQASRVRTELSLLERWHRSTQLPAYAELMQRAQTLAAAPSITPTQTCDVLEEVQRQIDTLAAQAVQRATPTAQALGPEQFSHLEAHYAKLNAEFRDEWLTPPPAKVLDQRFDKALERAERMYGRLDTAQRNLLREDLAASGYDAKLVDAERKRRQQDTLQTLRAVSGGRATPEQASTALAALVDRWRNSPQADYQSYSQRQVQAGCGTVARLHNAATPAQRARAVQRLKDYERELRELSGTQPS